jgi:hypothetical protein
LGCGQRKSPARNLDQGRKAPEDVGADQTPDARGYQGAGGSFHEIGEDPGNEEEKERDGSEEKSGASDARMGDAQDYEK